MDFTNFLRALQEEADTAVSVQTDGDGHTSIVVSRDPYPVEGLFRGLHIMSQRNDGGGNGLLGLDLDDAVDPLTRLAMGGGDVGTALDRLSARTFHMGIGGGNGGILGMRGAVKDGVGFLPVVNCSPTIRFYMERLLDGSMRVDEVPAVFATMLADPVFFATVESAPFQSCGEALRDAAGRWWASRVRAILAPDELRVRPLVKRAREEDGTAATTAAVATSTAPLTSTTPSEWQGGEGPVVVGPAKAGAATTANPQAAASRVDSFDDFTSHFHRYDDIRTVLRLLTVFCSSYRVLRPPYAPLPSCSSRLLLCRDPEVVYLGLLMNRTHNALPPKVVLTMPVMEVAAHGWGSSVSLRSVLERTWQEYKMLKESIDRTCAAGTEDRPPAPPLPFDIPTYARQLIPPSVFRLSQKRFEQHELRDQQAQGSPSGDGSPTTNTGSPTANTGSPSNNISSSSHAGTAGGGDAATTTATAAAGVASLDLETVAQAVLESMRQSTRDALLCLWWARCRLLAFSKLQPSARNNVLAGGSQAFFDGVWDCEELIAEILSDTAPAWFSTTRRAGESSTARARARARELYAGMVGAIADIAFFWQTVNAQTESGAARANVVSSGGGSIHMTTASPAATAPLVTAPGINTTWSVINAKLPGNPRFLRKNFRTHDEYWQYALLIDCHLTQVAAMNPRRIGQPMLIQLVELLKTHPEYYPALIIRTLGCPQLKEWTTEALHVGFVDGIVNCLRYHIPSLPTPPDPPKPSQEELDAAAVAAAAAATTTATATATAAAVPPGRRRGDRPPSPHGPLHRTFFSPPLAASDDGDRSGGHDDWEDVSSADANPAALHWDQSEEEDDEDEGEEEDLEEHDSDAFSDREGGHDEEEVNLFEQHRQRRRAQRALERRLRQNSGVVMHFAADGSSHHEDGDTPVREDEEEEGGGGGGGGSHTATAEEAAASPPVTAPIIYRQKSDEELMDDMCALFEVPDVDIGSYTTILSALEVLRQCLLQIPHATVNPVSFLLSPFDVPEAADPEGGAGKGKDEEAPAEGLGTHAGDGGAGTPTPSPSSSSSNAGRHDLCTLLHALLRQTRYGSLAASAALLLSACTHSSMRDMVPALAERGVVQTILDIAARPSHVTVEALVAERRREKTGVAAHHHHHNYSSSECAHAAHALAENVNINATICKMALPTLVQALTVHNTTQAVFMQHTQWIDAAINALFARPERNVEEEMLAYAMALQEQGLPIASSPCLARLLASDSGSGSGSGSSPARAGDQMEEEEEVSPSASPQTGLSPSGGGSLRPNLAWVTDDYELTPAAVRVMTRCKLEHARISPLSHTMSSVAKDLYTTIKALPSLVAPFKVAMSAALDRFHERCRRMDQHLAAPTMLEPVFGLTTTPPSRAATGAKEENDADDLFPPSADSPGSATTAGAATTTTYHMTAVITTLMHLMRFVSAGEFNTVRTQRAVAQGSVPLRQLSECVCREVIPKLRLPLKWVLDVALRLDRCLPPAAGASGGGQSAVEVDFDFLFNSSPAIPQGTFAPPEAMKTEGGRAARQAQEGLAAREAASKTRRHEEILSAIKAGRGVPCVTAFAAAIHSRVLSTFLYSVPSNYFTPLATTLESYAENLTSDVKASADHAMPLGNAAVMMALMDAITQQPSRYLASSSAMAGTESFRAAFCNAVAELFVVVRRPPSLEKKMRESSTSDGGGGGAVVDGRVVSGSGAADAAAAAAAAAAMSSRGGGVGVPRPPPTMAQRLTQSVTSPMPPSTMSMDDVAEAVVVLDREVENGASSPAPDGATAATATTTRAGVREGGEGQSTAPTQRPAMLVQLPNPAESFYTKALRLLLPARNVSGLGGLRAAMPAWARHDLDQSSLPLTSTTLLSKARRRLQDVTNAILTARRGKPQMPLGELLPLIPTAALEEVALRLCVLNYSGCMRRMNASVAPVTGFTNALYELSRDVEFIAMNLFYEPLPTEPTRDRVGARRHQWKEDTGTQSVQVTVAGQRRGREEEEEPIAVAATGTATDADADADAGPQPPTASTATTGVSFAETTAGMVKSMQEILYHLVQLPVSFDARKGNRNSRWLMNAAPILCFLFDSWPRLPGLPLVPATLLAALHQLSEAGKDQLSQVQAARMSTETMRDPAEEAPAPLTPPISVRELGRLEDERAPEASPPRPPPPRRGSFMVSRARRSSDNADGGDGDRGGGGHAEPPQRLLSTLPQGWSLPAGDPCMPGGSFGEASLGNNLRCFISGQQQQQQPPQQEQQQQQRGGGGAVLYGEHRQNQLYSNVVRWACEATCGVLFPLKELSGQDRIVLRTSTVKLLWTCLNGNKYFLLARLLQAILRNPRVCAPLLEHLAVLLTQRQTVVLNETISQTLIPEVVVDRFAEALREVAADAALSPQERRKTQKMLRVQLYNFGTCFVNMRAPKGGNSARSDGPKTGSYGNLPAPRSPWEDSGSQGCPHYANMMGFCWNGHQCRAAHSIPAMVRPQRMSSLAATEQRLMSLEPSQRRGVEEMLEVVANFGYEPEKEPVPQLASEESGDEMGMPMDFPDDDGGGIMATFFAPPDTTTSRNLQSGTGVARRDVSFGLASPYRQGWGGGGGGDGADRGARDADGGGHDSGSDDSGAVGLPQQERAHDNHQQKEAKAPKMQFKIPRMDACTTPLLSLLVPNYSFLSERVAMRLLRLVLDEDLLNPDLDCFRDPLKAKESCQGEEEEEGKHKKGGEEDRKEKWAAWRYEDGGFSAVERPLPQVIVLLLTHILTTFHTQSLQYIRSVAKARPDTYRRLCCYFFNDRDFTKDVSYVRILKMLLEDEAKTCASVYRKMCEALQECVMGNEALRLVDSAYSELLNQTQSSSPVSSGSPSSPPLLSAPPAKRGGGNGTAALASGAAPAPAAAHGSKIDFHRYAVDIVVLLRALDARILVNYPHAFISVLEQCGRLRWVREESQPPHHAQLCLWLRPTPPSPQPHLTLPSATSTILISAAGPEATTEEDDLVGAWRPRRHQSSPRIPSAPPALAPAAPHDILQRIVTELLQCLGEGRINHRSAATVLDKLAEQPAVVSALFASSAAITVPVPEEMRHLVRCAAAPSTTSTATTQHGTASATASSSSGRPRDPISTSYAATATATTHGGTRTASPKLPSQAQAIPTAATSTSNRTVASPPVAAGPIALPPYVVAALHFGSSEDNGFPSVFFTALAHRSPTRFAYDLALALQRILDAVESATKGLPHPPALPLLRRLISVILRIIRKSVVQSSSVSAHASSLTNDILSEELRKKGFLGLLCRIATLRCVVATHDAMSYIFLVRRLLIATNTDRVKKEHTAAAVSEDPVNPAAATAPASATRGPGGRAAAAATATATATVAAAAPSMRTDADHHHSSSSTGASRHPLPRSPPLPPPLQAPVPPGVPTDSALVGSQSQEGVLPHIVDTPFLDNYHAFQAPRGDLPPEDRLVTPTGSEVLDQAMSAAVRGTQYIVDLTYADDDDDDEEGEEGEDEEGLYEEWGLDHEGEDDGDGDGEGEGDGDDEEGSDEESEAESGSEEEESEEVDDDEAEAEDDEGVDEEAEEEADEAQGEPLFYGEDGDGFPYEAAVEDEEEDLENSESDADYDYDFMMDPNDDAALEEMELRIFQGFAPRNRMYGRNRLPLDNNDSANGGDTVAGAAAIICSVVNALATAMGPVNSRAAAAPPPTEDAKGKDTTTTARRTETATSEDAVEGERQPTSAGNDDDGVANASSEEGQEGELAADEGRHSHFGLHHPTLHRLRQQQQLPPPSGRPIALVADDRLPRLVDFDTERPTEVTASEGDGPHAAATEGEEEGGGRARGSSAQQQQQQQVSPVHQQDHTPIEQLMRSSSAPGDSAEAHGEEEEQQLPPHRPAVMADSEYESSTGDVPLAPPPPLPGPVSAATTTTMATAATAALPEHLTVEEANHRIRSLFAMADGPEPAPVVAVPAAAAAPAASASPSAPVEEVEAATGATAVEPPPPPAATEAAGPQPWEGSIDPLFLAELPSEMRSEIVFNSMELIRTEPSAYARLSARTRISPAFLDQMPEAVQEDVMGIEQRWLRVTGHADPDTDAAGDASGGHNAGGGGPGNELYEILLSVDADVRRDVLLTCNLDDLRGHPELLAEAEQLRAALAAEQERHEQQLRQRREQQRLAEQAQQMARGRPRATELSNLRREVVAQAIRRHGIESGVNLQSMLARDGTFPGGRTSIAAVHEQTFDSVGQLLDSYTEPRLTRDRLRGAQAALAQVRSRGGSAAADISDSRPLGAVATGGGTIVPLVSTGAAAVAAAGGGVASRSRPIPPPTRWDSPFRLSAVPIDSLPSPVLQTCMAYLLLHGREQRGADGGGEGGLGADALPSSHLFGNDAASDANLSAAVAQLLALLRQFCFDIPSAYRVTDLLLESMSKAIESDRMAARVALAGGDEELTRVQELVEGMTASQPPHTGHPLLSLPTPTASSSSPSPSQAQAARRVSSSSSPREELSHRTKTYLSAVMGILVSLLRSTRTVVQCFLLLPDGCHDADSLKPPNAPLDAQTELPFVEMRLFARLTRLVTENMQLLAPPYLEVLTLMTKGYRQLTTVDVPSSGNPPDHGDEPLSEELIEHPRHPHRLRWQNVRLLSVYSSGGFVCNVCGINPADDYCYHCDLCSFDLCAGCGVVRLSLEDDKNRLRRAAYHLLSAGGNTMPEVLALLHHPQCSKTLAGLVTTAISFGIRESAVRDGMRPYQLVVASGHAGEGGGGSTGPPSQTAHIAWPSCIQLAEEALIQSVKACVAEIRECHRHFKAEVLRVVAAAAEKATTTTPTMLMKAKSGAGEAPTPTSSTFGIALPEGFRFTGDAALGILYHLQLNKSERDNIFSLLLPYAESSRAECRELNVLWHATQTYMQDVTLVLQHLPANMLVPLPSSVFSLTHSFCQFHLSETRRAGMSASASHLGGSRSSGALRGGETENFLEASTHPSPLSEMAWEVVVKDAKENETHSALHTTTQGDKPEERRRLPRLVRKFLEANRVTLNALLHWDSSLLTTAFPFLRSEPSLIDFTFKLNDFRARIDIRRGTRITLNVDRHRCLEDSFSELKKVKSFNGPLQVRFKGEEGADAGGLTREWFQLLAKALVNESYALFIHSREGLTYQPNPFSDVNAAHIDYFRFAGVVVGLAVANNVPMDMHFTRAVYRHMVGVEPVFQDLESVDPELYTNLRWLLKNDVTGLDLTFAVNYERFGEVQEEDLVENGKDVAVTEANKLQYVRLLCQFHMTRRIEAQLVGFLTGFYSVIPRSAVCSFSEQELELVICGMPDIDVEDLRANTVYEGYNATSPQIRWFWEVVASMTAEDRANLLQFTTGASKVPQGGFANLESSHGQKQRFTISRWEGGTDLLPQAHTCFNKIDLPEYPSADALREKLMLAVTFGNMGFSMV